MKTNNSYKPNEIEAKWPSFASTFAKASADRSIAAKAKADKKASAGKQEFDPGSFEPYWQAVWEEKKVYSPDLKNAKNPYYNLMMFPYPSAEGLHVGNMYAFTGADIYGRFKRMQGNDVFEPIGLDGFGIHSENYALKVGRHPKQQAKVSQENFYRQLKSIGNGFDLTRTLETYDPEYYKWTQWLFIQLFKAGLAYRKKAEVNWCPSCKTVLADEQVLQRPKTKDQRPKIVKDIEVVVKVCERCDTEVEQKFLEQWFFRITDYADRLLDGLTRINWSEKVKVAQKNWIGRSEGALIRFKIEDLRLKKELRDNNRKSEVLSHKSSYVEVFTTRPDTLFGATFLVLTPEHEIVGEILKRAAFGEPRLRRVQDDPSAGSGQAGQAIIDEVRKYVEKAKNTTEIERTAEGKEKTGVFSGLYAINPVNNEQIPIWIADYVLSGYGTGAIMAVPAHDQRDFEFAKKYNLPIIPVIATRQLAGKQSQDSGQASLDLTESKRARMTDEIDASPLLEAYEGDGVLINSGEWDGLEMPKDMGKVLDSLEGKGLATRKSNYHLRDWLISRQRYWGPPIPMIFCGVCKEAGKTWFDENSVIASVARQSNKDKIASLPEAPSSRGGLARNDSDWNASGWFTQNRHSGEHRDARINERSWTSSPRFDRVEAGQDDRWDAAGWYPVSESDLPVLLPDVEDWRPEGIRSGASLRLGSGQAGQAKGPLANHPEFYKTTCPSCGGDAKRETDVSDTFLDSSWYFLRYPSVKTLNSKNEILNKSEIRNSKNKDLEFSISKLELPWDREVTRLWLPVDMYIGGAEHAVLHLLYSRFVTMALKDLGYLDFEEPFSKFYAHGLIIKDGAKMSKSKGNVVVPDEYIAKYGADALRTYLMFIGPYSDGGDFRDSGIEGIHRFLKRVWRLLEKSGPATPHPQQSSSINLRADAGGPPVASPDLSELDRVMHRTIKGVTEDIGSLKYNTAIAKLMEYYNFFSEFHTKYKILDTKYCKSFLLLLAPFAPHMTEELWQRNFVIASEAKQSNTDKIAASPTSPSSRGGLALNDEGFSSIHTSRWPEFDPEMLVSDTFTIVVQINGKRRGEIKVKSEKLAHSTDSGQEVQSEIEELAKEAVNKYLEGRQIKKTIYIKGKIINFVV